MKKLCKEQQTDVCGHVHAMGTVWLEDGKLWIWAKRYQKSYYKQSYSTHLNYFNH